MKLFHNIIVSVFIKPEEDYDLIKAKFLSLFPFDLDEIKIPIMEKNASTFNERKIKIVEVKLVRNKIVSQFMEHIKEKMSEGDRSMILRQLDNRIDEELNFFFRFSKKRMLEDKFVVVDHGDCFHLKCHVVSYPKRKEKAIKSLIDFFSC